MPVVDKMKKVEPPRVALHPTVNKKQTQPPVIIFDPIVNNPDDVRDLNEDVKSQDSFVRKDTLHHQSVRK